MWRPFEDEAAEAAPIDSAGAQDISAVILAGRRQAEADAAARRAERILTADRMAARAGKHEPVVVCHACGEPWPCPDAA